jgi:hypothetical protein
MLQIITLLVNFIYCSDSENIIAKSQGINEENIIANAEKPFDNYSEQDDQNPCPCFNDSKKCYELDNQYNIEHLEKFKETGECENCDLRNADLKGFNSATARHLEYSANLKGANLRCVDLSGSHFCGADFSNADLTGAQLPQVILENCNFKNAKLDFAKFNNAKILKCNFRGASLKNSNFFMADLTESDLSYTKLSNTIFDRANLAYTSFYQSSGSKTISFGITENDKRFTNFCCSIDEDGILNYEGCDKYNSSSSPTTSLNKCLNAVNSLELEQSMLEKLAPNGLPLSNSATGFITPQLQFPLPVEFGICNFKVDPDQSCQRKQIVRQSENVSN